MISNIERLFLAASFALFTTGALAAEKTADEGPRAYFNAGARAYRAGRYLAAVQAFEQAYRVEQRPGLLFSIAQAYRRQYFLTKQPEHLQEAIRHYRAYLAAESDGKRRADCAEALSELEPIALRSSPATVAVAPQPQAAVTQLMISSPVDEVSIALDGHAAGSLPYIAPVSPGVHKVRLTAPGYLPFERDIRVLEGTVVPLDVPLEEEPGRVLVRAPAGAHVFVDGRAAGNAPIGAISVVPGRHYLTVTKNGHEPLGMDVWVKRGEEKKVSAELETTGQRTTAGLFIAGGAVAVLTGAALTGVALWHQSKAEDIEETRAQGNISWDRARAYNRELEDRDVFRTAGLATAGAGLGILGIGAILFAFDEPHAPGQTPERPPGEAPESRPTLDIAAAPGGQGGTVHLRGVF